MSYQVKPGFYSFCIDIQANHIISFAVFELNTKTYIFVQAYNKTWELIYIDRLINQINSSEKQAFETLLTITDYRSFEELFTCLNPGYV